MEKILSESVKELKSWRVEEDFNIIRSNYMRNPLTDIYKAISEILVEILDIDPVEVTPEAYLIRDLGVESIDLMELAVSLNERFQIEVDEDLIFLKFLRPVIEKANEEQKDTAAIVAEKFSFLNPDRILEVLDDLEDGPVLKVKDLMQYIHSRTKEGFRHAD